MAADRSASWSLSWARTASASDRRASAPPVFFDVAFGVQFASVFARKELRNVYIELYADIFHTPDDGRDVVPIGAL